MGIDRTKMYDVVIAGAGLAGLTAALHLRKQGWEVLCVERDALPRHKVCGEYVSNEIREYLYFLGFNPKKYGCVEVEQFRMYGQSGKSLSHNLKMGGFGLSRYTMDQALFEIALDAGVDFIRDEVTAVTTTDQSVIQTLSGVNVGCKLFISAAGKRSKIDKALSREFMQNRTHWMGVKAHYTGQWNPKEVALYQFDGGYCGISNVEDDRVNVCYLVRTDEFKKYGDFDEFENKVICANPAFNMAIDQLERVMERKVISQIYFGKKEKGSQQASYLGDAAGMIYPLAGNGMAMAIHSSKLFCHFADEFLRGKKTRMEMNASYAKKWDMVFQARITRSRLIQSLMSQKVLSKLAMNTLPYFPWILSRIIEGTHGDTVRLENEKATYEKTT